MGEFGLWRRWQSRCSRRPLPRSVSLGLTVYISLQIFKVLSFLSYVYAGAGVVWDCYVNVTVTDADTKVKGACELPAVGAGNRTLVP